ncbi:MAG TPA: condensation domain-containing protein, partial [Herpetosiphonaceae bacterium]
LTPNGKVDRKALPQPERTSAPTTLVAPRTETETTLARIWADVLGLEQVGVHHNFFEVGGHSLLGTQVISRVRQSLGVELPLRALFEAPTIAALAQRIAAGDGQIRRALPPIQRVDRADELPLSFAQQRLWFIDQLQPGMSGYNIAAAVKLTGVLDARPLWQSLNDVVARHEVLRTTFAQRDGRAYQVIAPSLSIDLPLVDLCPLPQTERQAQAERLLTTEAQRLFDLRRGPLLRALLLRLDEQTHVLLLTMHHSISDGWSLGVFLREIAALYPAHAANTPAPALLPELSIQYADFAVWQRTELAAVLESQLAYWRQHLAGAPTALELPTDRPRPAVPTLRGAQHSAALPAALAEALRTLSASEGTTLFMTLLAAFDVLLHRYTGQTDIVVGSPIANRNRAEIEPLIGFFVNTLALRADLSGQPTFRELLCRVRAVALEAYAHQDLPFERLVDALQLPRDLSRPPLFQVMFVLQNAPLPSLNLEDLTLEPVTIDSRTSRFDLTLELVPTEHALTATFEYSTDLFEAQTIERMAAHWQMLLTAVVADPDQPIATLPLLSEAETRQLVHEWNATAAPFPAARSLPDL